MKCIHVTIMESLINREKVLIDGQVKAKLRLERYKKHDSFTMPYTGHDKDKNSVIDSIEKIKNRIKNRDEKLKDIKNAIKWFKTNIEVSV